MITLQGLTTNSRATSQELIIKRHTRVAVDENEKKSAVNFS